MDDDLCIVHEADGHCGEAFDDLKAATEHQQTCQYATHSFQWEQWTVQLREDAF